jgi:hypothetical protein
VRNVAALRGCSSASIPLQTMLERARVSEGAPPVLIDHGDISGGTGGFHRQFSLPQSFFRLALHAGAIGFLHLSQSRECPER